MKTIIKQVFKILLFWLLFFLVQRNVFLICLNNSLTEINIIEILLSNWYAIPLDISMASYFIIIPLILLFISVYSKGKWVEKTLLYYHSILIILTSLILIFDIGLYIEWGSKINTKAISYLEYPDKAFASSLSSPVFMLLSIFVILSIVGIWFYKKFLYSIDLISGRLYLNIIGLVIMLGLLVIGFRGGTQPFPISKSRVYFSKHSILNSAAVNSLWNCIQVMIKPEKIKKNPYKYFSNTEAEKILKSLHNNNDDSTKFVLKTEHPNIVLIILESWSGDIIESISGEKLVTPEFSKLCKEGLFFKNYYANGFRTEQCLAAIISNFPAQPKTTIIRKFGKFDRLPSIVKTLGENGYSSTYYSGGDLFYANTESYLKSAGFDNVKGEQEFDFVKRTKWGAYDHDFFNFCVNDIKNCKEPFFNILFTLTSHEPFDAEVESVFGKASIIDLYKNTIHYTDKSLGEFMKKAKEESWYNNTLFFIMADHAHRLPLNRKKNEAQRHRIPFLMYGEVLKDEYKGKVFERTGSHIDFGASLFSQLNITDNNLFWSKNIFNVRNTDFAFYTFNEGFGWVNNDGQNLIFDHQLNKVVSDSIKDQDKILKNGKAYLQILLEQYVGWN